MSNMLHFWASFRMWHPSNINFCRPAAYHCRAVQPQGRAAARAKHHVPCAPRHVALGRPRYCHAQRRPLADGADFPRPRCSDVAAVKLGVPPRGWWPLARPQPRRLVRPCSPQGMRSAARCGCLGHMSHISKTCARRVIHVALHRCTRSWHGCTCCEFARTIAWLSVLFVGDQIKTVAGSYSKMCSTRSRGSVTSVSRTKLRHRCAPALRGAHVRCTHPHCSRSNIHPVVIG
jgi:hypothetical protein